MELHEGTDDAREWNPPPGFYAAYCAYEEEALTAMSRLLEGGNPEDILSGFGPKPEEDILALLRSLPAKIRDRQVARYMMGREAAKKTPEAQKFIRELTDALFQARDKLVHTRYTFDE